MQTVAQLIKLKEKFLKFISPGVEAWTLQNIDSHIGYFFTYAQKHDITVLSLDGVTDWINSLVKINRSGATIEKYVSRLITFLTWCVNHGHIASNPIVWEALPKWKAGTKRKKKVIPEDEYRRLIAAVHRKGDTNWHDAIIVGRMTGLRISDVCLLKKTAVDWKHETLEVTPIKTRKFNKTVTIPMRAELFEVLKRRFDDPEGVYTFPGHEEYFFGEFHLAYMHDRGWSMRAQFKRRLMWAGIDSGYSFHCLRHTFISRLANADVSYKVIQSITGQCIQQIAAYHHVDLKTQRAAIMKA